MGSDLDVDVFTDHRIQVLSAGFAADVPHILESGDDIGKIVSRTTTLVFSTRISQPQPPEALDCSFSGEPRDFPYGIEYLSFAFLVRFQILHELLLKYILFCRHIHMATRYPLSYLPARFWCC